MGLEPPQLRLGRGPEEAQRLLRRRAAEQRHGVGEAGELRRGVGGQGQAPLLDVLPKLLDEELGQEPWKLAVVHAARDARAQRVRERLQREQGRGPGLGLRLQPLPHERLEGRRQSVEELRVHLDLRCRGHRDEELRGPLRAHADDLRPCRLGLRRAHLVRHPAQLAVELPLAVQPLERAAGPQEPHHGRQELPPPGAVGLGALEAPHARSEGQDVRLHLVRVEAREPHGDRLLQVLQQVPVQRADLGEGAGLGELRQGLGRGPRHDLHEVHRQRRRELVARPHPGDFRLDVAHPLHLEAALLEALALPGLHLNGVEVAPSLPWLRLWRKWAFWQIAVCTVHVVHQYYLDLVPNGQALHQGLEAARVREEVHGPVPGLAPRLQAQLHGVVPALYEVHGLHEEPPVAAVH
mmetsp:Transcript_39239/g.124726  ORF Transcript_39239/g.124726 Transcript_39239/m.124726 type:complete len:409 (-) Transcript_39239:411-1637(-)